MWMYIAIPLTLGFFSGVYLVEAHFKYIIRKQIETIQRDYEDDMKHPTVTPAMYGYASYKVKELRRML